MNNRRSKKFSAVIPAEAGIQDSGWIPACAGMTRKRNGFTLLEVTIVMALLVVMIGGAMSVMFSAQRTFDEGAMTNFLESQASHAVDILKDDISEGKVITSLWGWNYFFPCPNNSHSIMILQVPVEVGGSYWNPATGAVYWGADGQQDAISYYYISPTLWINEVNDKKDYNQDGDLNDSFSVCDMFVWVYNPTTGVFIRWEKLMSNIMISNNPWGYGDIDADGANDPIFTFLDKDGTVITEPGDTPSGCRLRLNFWLGGKLGANGNPILVNSKTEIILKNPQQ
jgi:prepilin-type N-terminal cleavage/methylation domain-containing protein